MKFLFVLFLTLLITSSLYCLNSGGILCGGEDEVPIWILRFKIIDRETHQPVKYSTIEIFKNKGDGMKWKADYNGVAVLVVTNPNCLPNDGTVEITSNNYQYYTQTINRFYFKSEEDELRIYLEGHRHNWTDMNQIPSTQELIDKITAKRYQVGVKEISSGYGFNWVNYAPACFEYEIEMDRVSDIYYKPRNDNHREYNDNNTNNNQFQIPSINNNGETIYVFPNDLSGGPYHWEQAKQACNSLNRLGFDDWYLPSKEELNILYLYKGEIGGFSDGWYWSSTESSYNQIWVQDFNDGNQDTQYRGTMYDCHKGTIRVRCIRKD